jgi:hypothetical protein
MTEDQSQLNMEMNLIGHGQIDIRISSPLSGGMVHLMENSLIVHSALSAALLLEKLGDSETDPKARENRYSKAKECLEHAIQIEEDLERNR